MKRNKVTNKWERFFCVIISVLLMPACMPVPVFAAVGQNLSPTIDTVLGKTRAYILKVDSNPDYSSIWNVIGISRSGLDIPDTYKKTFYNNVVNELEEKNWDYRTNRYSDYSKLILALTAIGVDASDVNGHNLFNYLSDFKKITKQGFNGPIWALIALNSHPTYQIPENKAAEIQTTEEGLVQYLLTAGNTDAGGWTLYGNTPDVDITAMTIQALAPYYYTRSDVKEKVDRALSWLSSAQMDSGGYGTLNGNSGTVETSESAAQAIVALCSLGIDPKNDERYVTSDGKWTMSRLFEYLYIQNESFGFMHVSASAGNNGGGAAGTLDGMATEQGLYATAAYKRFLEGKTFLYDMSDVVLTPGGASASSPTTATKSTTETRDTTESIVKKNPQQKKIKISQLSLNYKQITLTKGKIRTLKVKVEPSNASSKKVKWTTSNKRIATVTQKGKVKGIKAGKVNITVTARDGSKKKAVCKVIVKDPSSGNHKKSSGSASARVKVTGVSLNFKQISLEKGYTKLLTASVIPSNAFNSKLTWTSSNKNIATVTKSGLIKGVSNGTAIITAKASDGSGKSAYCTVIVYDTDSRSSGQSISHGLSSSGQASYGSASFRYSQVGPSSSGPENIQQASNSNAVDQSSQSEASLWSFEVPEYVPDTSGSLGDSALTKSDLFGIVEDDKEAMGGDYAFEKYADNMVEDTSEDSRPVWLSVLLGLISSGCIAGCFKVPWIAIGDKLFFLCFSKRRVIQDN